jgi:hypothetical protein
MMNRKNMFFECETGLKRGIYLDMRRNFNHGSTSKKKASLTIHAILKNNYRIIYANATPIMNFGFSEALVSLNLRGISLAVIP